MSPASCCIEWKKEECLSQDEDLTFGDVDTRFHEIGSSNVANVRFNIIGRVCNTPTTRDPRDCAFRCSSRGPSLIPPTARFDISHAMDVVSVHEPIDHRRFSLFLFIKRNERDPKIQQGDIVYIEEMDERLPLLLFHDAGITRRTVQYQRLERLV